MVAFPPAKINIGLHVTAKRPDGFHEINTLLCPVGLHDVLEMVPSGAFSLTLYGLPVAGNPQDNLCVKAYELLRRTFSLPPVAMHLYKAIPLGAGLGGGSADATHTLLLLDKLFQLHLSTAQLEAYAAQLGSDCAFFVHTQPLLAGGRGELLTAAPALALSGYAVVLCKPPVHIGTAEAYAGITPRQPATPLAQLLTRPVSEWKDTVHNDFEPSIFARHPLLAQCKQQLYRSGAVYAAMSGSGSALYGLFADHAAARRAARQLPEVVFCGMLSLTPK